MQHSKALVFGLVLASALVAVLATDALTLTVGGTAYVLSATQASVAAASIAGLALAKKALILAHLKSRQNRGRREANEISQAPPNFQALFEGIARSDVADCGKLLVCHSMAKTLEGMTAEEKLIAQLFDDLEVVDPTSGYAEYQLAAYAGTFKHPELCTARYSRCPVSPNELGDLIKVRDF